jgi:Ca2+-transporting ATPase
MFIASLLGWPMPLLPIHLLWINLVTDGLPALALSVEPGERNIMRRNPRPPGEPVIPMSMARWIFFQGVLVAVVGLLAFGWIYLRDPSNVALAQTVTFCVVVFDELFRAIANRSRTMTVWRLGLFSNPFLMGALAVSTVLQLAAVGIPFLQPFFKCAPMSAADWLVVVVLAPLPLIIIESIKGLFGSTKVESSQ